MKNRTMIIAIVSMILVIAAAAVSVKTGDNNIAGQKQAVTQKSCCAAG